MQTLLIPGRSYIVLVFAFTLSFAQVLYGEELRIGATLALTGPYSTFGRNALHGIELAVQDINAQGGVAGRPVKLIVEDSGTLDLRKSITTARKLIDIDKVRVLLPLIIEDSEVIVPLTSKIPMFTMAVGCGARKCGSNVGRYHVRGASSHDTIIERLVEHAKEKNIKHACIVAAAATYFEGYGRYIEELSKQAGQKVSYESVPLDNAGDHRDIATRFKQKQCDAIYSWIGLGSLGPFFRRVRESGSNALLFGLVEADDPSVLQSAGSAAEGVVYARFSLGSPGFQKRFQERFGHYPAHPAVPTYDAVKVLLQTIKEVGTEAEALRQAFSSVKNLPAENGSISYTTEGERYGEVVELMEIRNGKSVLIASKLQTAND